jgi:large subunit ribosomal protein L7/L12
MKTMSDKITGILDQIGGLTVLELVDLNKAIEEKFGVTAAAPVMMAGPVAAGGGEAAAKEEKTTFDVILSTSGDKKIQVIKEVRAITNLGLKEAKDLVDKAPQPVKTGVSKEEAEKIKTQIEAAGGTVQIK